MEEIWEHLDPVLEHLATLDLSDSESVARSLTEKFGDLPALQALCREHVAQLRDHEEAIREAGASLAAVGLGDRSHARAFRRQTGIDFPLLIDAGRRAYRALELAEAPLHHLLRRDNAAAFRRAAGAGHRQHRLGRNPMQLGGSFVFGPGNVDLYAHVSNTFGDNVAPADLLAALRSD